MPIVRYLSDREKNCNLRNKIVASSLEELRKTTGKDWQICERKVSWFRRFTRHQMVYSLYVISGISYSGGDNEYQLINMYDEKSGSSTEVSADTIVAWIEGYLSCYESVKYRM